VLCALGLATAPPRWDAARTLLLSGPALSGERLERERGALLREAGATISQAPARVRVRHELRYRGQSFELAVEEELLERGRRRPGLEPDALCDAFAEAHERRYGYRDAQAPVELVNMRVSVWGAAPALAPLPTGARPPAVEEREVIFDGRASATRVLRGELPPGTRLEGPTLCALPQSTLLVPAGWSGTVDEHGTIRLERER
jgi:N-methylhydantoinase A